MKYRLDIVTNESYLCSGRYEEVEADNYRQALEKGKSLCRPGEWTSQVVESEIRPGEEGLRIVWDVMNGCLYPDQEIECL